MAQEASRTVPAQDGRQRRYRWSELQELIFLDRYARKGSRADITVGDTVVVLTREHPKYPQKEAGEVVAVDGDDITVRLRSGELFTQKRARIDRPLETRPEDMWDRMARAIVQVEPKERRKELEKEFRWLLQDWRFVPGGRINAMLGTGQNLTAYNCYVIPIRPDDPSHGNDSRRAIMDTLRNMVEIMARGGGVGINLSTLRPRLAYVQGVNGKSSGSVSWGQLFSTATGLVEQGGSRRGALMLILNVWHPDIIEFINAKRDFGVLTNANVSVGLTDDFERALDNDEDWDLVFPDYEAVGQEIYDREWDGNLRRWQEKGYPIKVYQTVRARDLWRMIVESAWASAEPGIVRMDYSNRMSNTWYFHELIATNPCGEQFLPAWGVCNLGHINLSRFVENGQVLWDDLKKAARLGVRFLDNVIDITPYFFEENERVQKAERRIGMGTMGLAEMLIKLGLRYGSPESLEMIDQVYRTIAVEAYLGSVELAQEKGAFPMFDAEKFLQSGFMQGMPEEVRAAVREKGIRNATLLTQAPTGTTGTMVGTSTGIEPYYQWTYWRTGRLGRKEVNEAIVQEWFDAHPEVEPKLENLPDYFVTALDLTPEEHVRVQAAIQRWVDSSISKTTNCPADWTVEQVEELYALARQLGCKGVTIYRDKSRDEQVLSRKEEAEAAAQAATAAAGAVPAGATGAPVNGNGTMAAMRDASQTIGEVPEEVAGYTFRQKTMVGTARITVNEKDGEPFETIIVLGKGGMDVTADSEAMGRLISLYLRTPSPVPNTKKLALVVEQLRGIGGAQPFGFGPNKVLSLPDALAKALERYLHRKVGDRPASDAVQENAAAREAPAGAPWAGAGNPAPPADPASYAHPAENGAPALPGADLCPACGSFSFIKAEGCGYCRNCGHSTC
ncbi:MAG TPA: adenosylcobalamin-dependent ribonucleoside-diphosphate reductase [Limnochordales bacterium]|nr:adenosylcobalamin-dependent ribonucleoside-diphosphate reductase [Limnochordales bacterium]